MRFEELNDVALEEVNGGVLPVIAIAGLGKVIGGVIAAGAAVAGVYFTAYAIGKEEGYEQAKYEYYHELNNPTPVPTPTL